MQRCRQAKQSNGAPSILVALSLQSARGCTSKVRCYSNLSHEKLTCAVHAAIQMILSPCAFGTAPRRSCTRSYVNFSYDIHPTLPPRQDPTQALRPSVRRSSRSNAHQQFSTRVTAGSTPASSKLHHPQVVLSKISTSGRSSCAPSGCSLISAALQVSEIV